MINITDSELEVQFRKDKRMRMGILRWTRKPGSGGAAEDLEDAYAVGQTFLEETGGVVTWEMLKELSKVTGST